MEASIAHELRPVPDWRDELANAARRVADLLGLRDWTVAVDDDPPPAGLDAQATVDGQRHRITLRFREDFDELTDEQRVYLLVHELFHAHLQVLAGCVLQLQDEFGRTAWDVFWAGFEQETERVIDRLASVVVTLMPPVEWRGPTA